MVLSVMKGSIFSAVTLNVFISTSHITGFKPNIAAASAVATWRSIVAVSQHDQHDNHADHAASQNIQNSYAAAADTVKSAAAVHPPVCFKKSVVEGSGGGQSPPQRNF